MSAPFDERNNGISHDQRTLRDEINALRSETRKLSHVVEQQQRHRVESVANSAQYSRRSSASRPFRYTSAASLSADKSSSVREAWQPIQIRYVESIQKKCAIYMYAHEEAHRYYRTMHYRLVIPATIIGVVTSGTAFTTWSDNALCSETYSWPLLVVAILVATAAILHNLSEFVLKYSVKADQHKQSYSDYSGLHRRIANELNNPETDHKPYRQFLDAITELYDQYAEQANILPAKVNAKIRDRWRFDEEPRNDNPAAADNNQQQYSTTSQSHHKRKHRKSVANTAKTPAAVVSTLPSDIAVVAEYYAKRTTQPRNTSQLFAQASFVGNPPIGVAELQRYDDREMTAFAQRHATHIPVECLVELSSSSAVTDNLRDTAPTFSEGEAKKKRYVKKRKKPDAAAVTRDASKGSKHVVQFRLRDKQTKETQMDEDDEDEDRTPNELQQVHSGVVQFTDQIDASEPVA